MRIRIFISAVLMAAVPLSGSAGEGDRYSNPRVGLVVEKPSSWHFLSVQSMMDNRQRVRLKDEELAKRIRERAREPLVVIAKHRNPASRSGVTPTAQIGFSPLGSLEGAPPERVLGAVLQPIARGFADFQLVKPVHATSVAGLAAAHVVADYRLANREDESFAVRARLWVVPRGAFGFIIGMSGPVQGENHSEEEFAEILNSIFIEH